MQFPVRGLLVVILLLTTVRTGFAACTDSAAVAMTRMQADQQCPCAGAADHGAYVKCVAGVAKAAVTAGTLPKQCSGAVKKCAAKSTCGKLDFVTCCITKNGATKCKTAKDSATCIGKGGAVGACASCCDACTPDGCSTSTTTTTTTTTITTTTITATTSTTTPTMPTTTTPQCLRYKFYCYCTDGMGMYSYYYCPGCSMNSTCADVSCVDCSTYCAPLRGYPYCYVDPSCCP